ncbi:MAG: anthranilate synthase component I [Candidatus Omnitrophota bacterium]
MEIYPSFAGFKRLADGTVNIIPVSCEILADLETPVSAYRKVVGSKPGFLLESVEGGEKVGRYSFLGANPGAVIRTKKTRIEIEENGRTLIKEGNPLSFLREYLRNFKSASDPTLPRFSGGLVGYFAYDVVRFLERLPDNKPDLLDVPDIQVFLADTLLVFDHLRQRLKVITYARPKEGLKKSYQKAVENIEEIIGRLRNGFSQKSGNPSLPNACRDMPLSDNRNRFDSNFTRPQFESAVLKAKDYITRGDAIQIVLSQRLSLEYSAKETGCFDLYRAVRSINPSPYLYYLNFGKMALVGSSPEVMVRLEGDDATLRPIAGTRRRGKDGGEDLALEAELRGDEKEKAEHIMLVDLGRNDLGRVCRSGSVQVTELMTVERYSHVMHLVSNITGKIMPDKDAFDLFSASFPAGTVSGAPKVRAMEIIDELEPDRRGPYAGAVGYFDFAGNLDTCITIRTVLIKDGRAYLQVGAGIVADSVPNREYDETLNKGKALLEALKIVSSGTI